MAKTSVVNPRRRRRRRPATSGRRRRRNYGAAQVINPRRRRSRRRRRNYGAAASNPRRRSRRRNPVSPYASQGYYRRANPQTPGLDELMEVLPPATAGVLAQRFALKQSGAWEADTKTGTLEPGLKQAVALYLGATFGAQLIGNVMGGESARRIAFISAMGFAGDLFLTKRFMRDSDMLKSNFSLQGDEDGEGYYVEGFSPTSPLGAETMRDAFGNVFTATDNGWQMLGADDYVVDEQTGQVYQLQGGGGARLAGFSTESPLGFHTPGSGLFGSSNESSFGYSRR